MTLKFISALASKHFLKYQEEEEDVIAIIQRHAMEEMGLSKEVAHTFARGPKPEWYTQLDSDFSEKFYLWYYFTYMAPPTAEILKETKWVTGPLPPKKKIEVSLYAVVKVTAVVEDPSSDKAIEDWRSNCTYLFGSIPQFRIATTEFLGTSLELPIIQSDTSNKTKLYLKPSLR